MVAEDRTNPGLARERELARTVVATFELAPPVDLEGVAGEFVDVEMDHIPGECDGLVVEMESPRPLVLIQADHAEVRQRFTLAHELGHVLMPWHLGSGLLCSTDPSNSSLDPYAGYDEVEANRFAGELLVPREWLDNLIADVGGGRVAPALEVIAQANVSAHVANLRLLDALPAGHLFAMIDIGGRVELAGKTGGTSGIVPGRGSLLDRTRLDQFATTTEEARYGDRRLIWWSFRPGVEDDRKEAEPDPSAVILERLLDAHSPGPSERVAIARSLSGIIGAAKSVAIREGATTTAELYARFRLPFAKPRALPDSLLDDPDFDRWLRRRADELASL
jgi:hypothetical protein